MAPDPPRAVKLNQGYSPNTRSSGSPSNSDLGFDDEVILVAPPRPHAPPPVASTSTSAPAEPAKLSSPLETPPRTFATHRRWTLEVPTHSPRPLSDKAKGKRTLEGERATPPKRVASPPSSTGSDAAKKRRTGLVFDGVEIPVRAAGSSASKPRPVTMRLHTRWTSNESELVSHSPFGSPTSAAAAAALSPPEQPSSMRRSHSFELVVEARSSPAAKRARISASPLNSTRRASPPGSSRSAAGSSPAPARASPAVPRRRESTFELVVESQPSPARHPRPLADLPATLEPPIFPAILPAPPARLAPTPPIQISPRPFTQPLASGSRPRVAALASLAATPVPAQLNFTAKPASHPLNQLRLRPPPAPPPAMPTRHLNPVFTPAAALGWVPGSYPKKRSAPRPRARSRTPILPQPAIEPSPAPSSTGSGGQRRSGRATMQARPASAVYPSAAERLALSLAPGSGSSSRASSASPSRSPPPIPARTAKPPRRKPLLAQLRAKYAFLSEADRAPFRADNSCEGINPEPLSFEWDERELRLAARKEGFPADGGAGPCAMRSGGGKAAELVLRAEEGDPRAREELSQAWRETEWRYRDWDEARGRAGNRATGWATRDWRMHPREDEEVDEWDAESVTETIGGAALTSPVRERFATASPERERAHAGGRKRGATITDVPPSTSSAFGGDEIEMRVGSGESDDDAEAEGAREREREDAGMRDASMQAYVPVASTSVNAVASGTSSSSSRSSDLVVSPSKPATTLVAAPPDERSRSPSASARSDAGVELSLVQPAAPASVTADASEDETEATSPELTSPKRVDKGKGRAVDSSGESGSVSPAPQPQPTGAAGAGWPSDAGAAAASSSSPSTSPPKPLSPRNRSALLASSPVKPFGTASSSSSTASSRSSTPVPALPAPAPPKRKQGRPPTLTVAPPAPTGGLPKGMVRCDHPSCPQPVYQAKAASSEATHAKSYHDAVCVVTYQLPYRTTRLTRDDAGAFRCPCCAFVSMNALSTKQHAYVKKTGKACPGPPAEGRDVQAERSAARRDTLRSPRQ
ncbi:hypothetical protein JCM10450v2_000898 [Rhodotorula kratochvilovae]